MIEVCNAKAHRALRCSLVLLLWPLVSLCGQAVPQASPQAVSCGTVPTSVLAKSKPAAKAARDPSTALLEATDNDDLRTVQNLLRRGANVNARDSHCGTPLMMAAGNADPAMVQLLLKSGAEVDAQD